MLYSGQIYKRNKCAQYIDRCKSPVYNHKRVSSGTRWRLRQPDEEIVQHLRDASGLPESIVRVLVNRGYYDMDAVERFSVSSLRLLHDPFLLGGVTCGAERVIDAIRNGEHIVVYGDYDVDGITATALLTYVLRALGGSVSYFVPNRTTHGYGLHCDTIASLAEAGARVLITVDCGINAIEPARLAQKLGLDLIITDHHEPQIEEEVDEYELLVQASLFEFAVENGGSDDLMSRFNVVLPPAFAVINPKLGHYPFSELAGVGVAFKFAHGVLKMAREQNLPRAFDVDLKEHLDLVALGTIADAVPLRDENRILAKHGLAALAATRKAGLRKLIEVSRLRNVNVESVVFGLAPRLNAAGRLGDAGRALELLLTANIAEAEVLARDLDAINRTRQKIERETFENARHTFEATLGVELPDARRLPGGLRRYLPDGPNIIVIASEEWNPGVIGIVASRMVERYYMPTVIIALQDGMGRGSCRSIRDFHIFDALRQCSALLNSYGGHKVAAGLSVVQGNIDELRVMLDKIAGESVSNEEFTPALDIDAQFTMGDCTLEFCEQLESFKPYGQGNPRPAFVARGAKLVEDPVVLKDRHVKFCVMQEGEFRHIIAFNWADRVQELLMWAQMDVVVHPYLDFYRGEPSIEMQLIDAKEAL
jgi:single-stranded-DNA-specific exonuclease